MFAWSSVKPEPYSADICVLEFNDSAEHSDINQLRDLID